MQRNLTQPARKQIRASTGSQPSQTKTLPLLSTSAAVLLLTVTTLFAVAPLFYPGYVQSHDGFSSVWNVADLRANLGNLSWTPHISTTFDPLRSSGLLPYYVAALLPLTPTAAVKATMALGWIMGGWGMFFWLKSWLGQPGAFVAALVYTYLPYQIVNVYVRGAWGEILFWGLLPWAILAAAYLVTMPKPVLLPAAAFFWLALGLSQLGLTIVALLFISAMLLVIHRPQALLPLLAAGLGIAGAVAVVLLLPLEALFYAAPAPITDHLLYPFQLFSAMWGFGASRPGWQDGLSLQLGLAAAGLTVVTVAIWLREGDSVTIRADRRLIFFLTTAAVLSLLLMGVATFIWRLLGGLLTYPWQVLGFVGLCLAVMSGAALWLDQRLAKPPLLASITLIVILSVYPYLLPNFVQPEPAWLDGPQAALDNNRLLLLDHAFTVVTTGHTAGLETGNTTTPLPQHGPLQPHQTLMLEVAWQPLHPFNDDLKVFAHLVDADDNVVAQFDGYPQAGGYPTSQWRPGAIINDSYAILLPGDLPAGPYRIFLGLYDEATLTRLPVPDNNEGRIVLDVR